MTGSTPSLLTIQGKATSINNRVQAEMNWLMRHPEYVDRVFNRAQRFLPYITREIDERGLPLELALLPGSTDLESCL